MTCLHLDGVRWNPALPTAVPVLVETVELSERIRPLQAKDEVWAYLLVLAHEQPVGWITCPITNGQCLPADIRRAVTEQLRGPALSALLSNRLMSPIRGGTLSANDLFQPALTSGLTKAPLITIAVCTRDRPLDLARCLRSLKRLNYPNFEVVVVDSASRSGATRELVEAEFPDFQYVREDRAGLDRARNRALSVAKGELIAYTDDDTVVDAGWLLRIAAALQDESVAGVTGLIVPLELRTEAQLYFEVIGGFGRGCRKAWYRVDPRGNHPDVYHLGAGRFGAGANMAFRTSILRSLSGFDPALDVGTPTEGGGDLEIFFRLLHERYTIMYEPAAIVWHRHRDTLDTLAAQINTWGTAIGAFLTAAFLRYAAFRWRVFIFGMRWSWSGYLGPAIRSLIGPGRAPRRLRFGPLRRLPLGPIRYLKASWQARLLGASSSSSTAERLESAETAICEEVSTCEVDLSRELAVLTAVAGFRTSEVRVFVGTEFIGTVCIENRGCPIFPSELRYRIATDLRERLLSVVLKQEVIAAFHNLEEIFYAQLECEETPLDEDFRPTLASVVVATRNRPQQLRRCLDSLSTQMAEFPYEIVVVDNDPASGMTEHVVRDFPWVRYVAEPVQGLSPARNTGFQAARGDILIATDDDVMAPPGWIQELVQPFRFAHVGLTTGRVLPLSLRNEAQREFEILGGLGKGATSFEVGLDWLTARSFQPARVWDLGATANAAVRRIVLEDSRVGLLAESLGPGTPAGGGEDAYLFYRALLAGYTIYYEANAVVFHDHRSSMQELRRQSFDYGRGHVAYLLTTLLDHGDVRALGRLLLVLPLWHFWRLLAPGFLRPRHNRRIVLAELLGCLAGPICWLYSRRREKALTRAAGRANRVLTPGQSDPSESAAPFVGTEYRDLRST